MRIAQFADHRAEALDLRFRGAQPQRKECLAGALDRTRDAFLRELLLILAGLGCGLG